VRLDLVGGRDEQVVADRPVDHHQSRPAGLERLADFVPRAGAEYRKWRNHDLGPDRRANVSGLSPYLTHRLIREREVAAAVLARHSFRAAEKFLQEVCWRTYWKGWLEMRPQVWCRYRSTLSARLEAMVGDARLEDGFAAASEGRTGIECFDAWANELITTGYLHNHARMWFASIWIFTLGLPWQQGADFFIGTCSTVILHPTRCPGAGLPDCRPAASITWHGPRILRNTPAGGLRRLPG
jgi:deoxyribodipyrimidine photo-lyase